MTEEMETHTPIIGELRRHKNATDRGTPPSYPDPSHEPSDPEPSQKDSTIMIVDETVKQCAAPFSQPTIDELRAAVE